MINSVFKKSVLVAVMSIGLGTAFVPSTTVMAAGIRTQTIEITGVGPTRQDAIRVALAEAVGNVKGIHVSSVTHKATVQEIKTRSNKETTESTARISDGMQNDISTRTSGDIRRYRVVDESYDEQSKMYHVKVAADINYYQADQASERARIAVVPFEIKKPSPLATEFNERLNQALVDDLTGTRKFAILDRDYQKQRLNELKGLMREDARLEERARIGNSLGTDFLLVGSITNFTAHKEKVKVPFTNETMDRIAGSATVMWRLIEASTGQIMASGTFDKPVQIKSNAQIAALAVPIGKDIASTIAGQIYPITALAFKDGRLTLSQGGTTLKVGEHYRLMKYGATLTDPYTHELLAPEEIPVGEVEIVDVLPKLAYAKVISSTVDLNQMGPKEYILRPMTSSAQKKAPEKAKNEPNW